MTYISARIRKKSNEFLTAITMFRGHATRRCQAYKLRYMLFRIHFRLMTAIFDLSLAQTSESIQACCTVLPDLIKWCCCLAYMHRPWKYVSITSDSQNYTRVPFFRLGLGLGFETCGLGIRLDTSVS